MAADTASRFSAVIVVSSPAIDATAISTGARRYFDRAFSIFASGCCASTRSWASASPSSVRPLPVMMRNRQGNVRRWLGAVAEIVIKRSTSSSGMAWSGSTRSEDRRSEAMVSKEESGSRDRSGSVMVRTVLPTPNGPDGRGSQVSPQGFPQQTPGSSPNLSTSFSTGVDQTGQTWGKVIIPRADTGPSTIASLT